MGMQLLSERHVFRYSLPQKAMLQCQRTGETEQAMAMPQPADFLSIGLSAEKSFEVMEQSSTQIVSQSNIFLDKRPPDRLEGVEPN
ncbi:hypothetical protein GGR44_003172 [Sphingobium fontiphilum]|uniref:Uncharacterized protein n=1 Tax=Sphingobium fontiphilum TaxID=944425 RepID=A0A7W6DHQ0_9SPHN|nr:hypothetical protein [Sphingobium fontiphilum]MBB3983481.1 hypothetical protein [Sphingobium fontiphilum]